MKVFQNDPASAAGVDATKIHHFDLSLPCSYAHGMRTIPLLLGRFTDLQA